MMLQSQNSNQKLIKLKILQSLMTCGHPQIQSHMVPPHAIT